MDITHEEKIAIYREMAKLKLRKYREDENRVLCPCGKTYKQSRRKEHVESKYHIKKLNIPGIDLN